MENLGNAKKEICNIGQQNTDSTPQAFRLKGTAHLFELTCAIENLLLPQQMLRKFQVNQYCMNILLTFMLTIDIIISMKLKTVRSDDS